MTTRTAGRHRAECRAKTPLTAIGEAVSTNASSVSRRSAVLAASSGLIVTMGLPAVGATHSLESEQTPASPTTTQSLSAVPAQETVSVPSDAQVSFALSAVTTVDAAQYEHDAAAAAAERDAVAARASRSATRTTAATSSGASASSSTVVSMSNEVVTGAGTVAAIDIARRYFGIRYRYGGTTPAGFDCSGFVQYVFRQMGVALPRTASEQASSGTRISASQARAGDIVSYLGKGGVYHNGIYAGNGLMIDSPRSGKAISLRPLFSSSVVFTRVGA